MAYGPKSEVLPQDELREVESWEERVDQLLKQSSFMEMVKKVDLRNITIMVRKMTPAMKELFISRYENEGWKRVVFNGFEVSFFK